MKTYSVTHPDGPHFEIDWYDDQNPPSSSQLSDILSAHTGLQGSPAAEVASYNNTGTIIDRVSATKRSLDGNAESSVNVPNDVTQRMFLTPTGKILSKASNITSGPSDGSKQLYSGYAKEAAGGWFHSSEAPSKYGLHPDASAWLKAIGIPASRIGQTIGNAGPSSGTHLPEYSADGNNQHVPLHWYSGPSDHPVKHPYSAAVDISVRGMSQQQIRNTLQQLGMAGFAAWYRNPGHDGWPVHLAEHIHAVYAGVEMKPILQRQVLDYLQNKTGLKRHQSYNYMDFGDNARNTVRDRFRSVYGSKIVDAIP